MNRKHAILHESGKTYVSRDLILKDLGFFNYADYLNSRLWYDLRFRVFREKGSYCFTCPDLACQLHHNDYRRETLLGDDISAIVPICEPCHRSIEVDQHGKKTKVHQAAAAWRRLRSIYLALVRELG